MMKDSRTSETLGKVNGIYKFVFDHALDGISLVDIETKKFLMGNPIFCNMLGYREQDLKSLCVHDMKCGIDSCYITQ